MAFPRQTITNFSGGLNTTMPAFKLSDSTGAMQFPVINNLMLDMVGLMVVRGGQRKLIPASIATSPKGLFHFVNDVTERIMLATNGHVYTYLLDGTIGIDLTSDLDASKEINFASMYSDVFWTDGAKQEKWDGVATQHYIMGIEPPSTAPVDAAVSISAGVGIRASQMLIEVQISAASVTVPPIVAGPNQAGQLDSSVNGYSPYKHYYTFVTANGLESNPSPASNDVNVNQQKVLVTGISVSADPQVTKRYLYRVGGSSTQIRFVAEIADNTTTTYTDNIPDIDLSTDILSFAHDRPPSKVTFFMRHDQRMLAGGDPDKPNRMYVSSYQEPEYWPTIIETALTDGGFFDVTSSFDDPVIGFGSIGSVALAFCKLTVYALFGSSFEDGGDAFVLRKITDKGCSARKSIITCINSIVYLSHDGEVYSIVDNEPELLSKDIRKTLTSISETDRANACAYYIDNKYILVIPIAGSAPIGYVYDFTSTSWTSLIDANVCALQFDGPKSTGFGGELWFATPPGYQFDGVAYNGIVACMSSTSVDSKIPVSWSSPEFEFNVRSYDKIAKHLRIEGDYVPFDPDVPMRATVRAYNPSGGSISHSYKLTRTTGMLLDIGLHADLRGRRLQVSLAGDVKSGSISTIELQYTRDIDEAK